jgi:hypothetical protein
MPKHPSTCTRMWRCHSLFLCKQEALSQEWEKLLATKCDIHLEGMKEHHSTSKLKGNQSQGHKHW